MNSMDISESLHPLMEEPTRSTCRLSTSLTQDFDIYGLTFSKSLEKCGIKSYFSNLQKLP